MPFKYKAYGGSIIRVDLTREKIVKEPLSPDLAEKFLGGEGFISKILWDEVSPQVKSDILSSFLLT